MVNAIEGLQIQWPPCPCPLGSGLCTYICNTHTPAQAHTHTHTHPHVPRMRGQQILPHFITHDLRPGKEGVGRGVTVVSLAQNLKESVKSGEIAGKRMWG